MTGPHGGGRNLADQAADPTTAPAILQQLAQHHPELRATIAENPATYPALLDWLSGLGHPEVSLALDRRAAREAAAARQADTPSVPSSPGEQGAGSPDAGHPTGAGHVAGVAGAAAGPPAVARKSILGRPPSGPSAGTPGNWAGQPTHVQPQQPDDQLTQAPPTAGYPASAPSWQPAQQRFPQPQPTQPPPTQPQPPLQQPWQPTAAAGTGEPAGGLFVTPEDHEPERPNRSWIPLAALAALAAILVLVVVLLLTRGGEEEPGDAGGPPAQTTEQPEEPRKDTDQAGQSGDLEEARQDLAGLAGTSSCEDPDGDAAVFAQFAAKAEQEDAWGGAEDDFVVETLQQLQDACGNVHAVEVAEVLGGGEDTPAPLVNAIEQAGTGWVELEAPAPEGATTVGAFSAPSRNIHCDLEGEAARCRIVDHDFDAPDGCQDGTTLAIGVTGPASADCANPVGDQSTTLDYGGSAVSGFFACTSDESGVRCWSTLTGEGFEMARARYDTF